MENDYVHVQYRDDNAEGQRTCESCDQSCLGGTSPRGGTSVFDHAQFRIFHIDVQLQFSPAFRLLRRSSDFKCAEH